MTKYVRLRLFGILFCLLMLTGILAIAAEPVWADTTPGFAVQPQTVYRPKNGNAVLSFSLNFDPEGQDARLAIERPDPVLGTVYYWIDQNFTDPEGNPAVTKQNMTIVVNWQWERDDPYVIRLDYNGSEYRSDPFYITQELGFIVQPSTVWLDTESDPDAEKKVSFELNFTPDGERIFLFWETEGNIDFRELTGQITSWSAEVYFGKDDISKDPYYILLKDISGREYRSEPFYVLNKGTHLFTKQPEDVLILDGQPAEVSWSVDYYPEPFTQMAGHTAGATFWITGGKIGFHQSLKLISAYYEIKGDNQGISIEEDRDMSITVDADWVSVAPYQIVNIPLTSPSGGGHRFGSRMFYIREAWTVRYHMGAAYDRPDTSEHVLTGELANLPKMPAEINGYVFGGWYTDSGFTHPYDSSAPVTETLDLYARWNKRSYEVSFDLVGGTSAAIPAQIISYGNTVAAPADPTKPGGTFAGWYTDPNYEHVYDFSRPVSEALILYAKWDMQTFLVSFNNRGIGTKPATQTVTYGAIAVEPKKLYQNGYIFGGWYTNGGFTEDHHFDFSTPITQHTNLNAKWTKLCTVTFKPGEGSGTMTGRRPPAGSVLTVPESTFAAPEGKRFRYWVCGGTYYSAGRAITVYDDMEFTAVWDVIPYRTITFDMNGRGGQIDPMQVELNTVPTPPADPAVGGNWEFTGWYTTRQAANMSSAAYLFDFTQPLTDNKTLYAGWRDNTAYKIKLVFAGQGVGTAWLENDTEDFVNQSEDVYYAHPGDRIYIRDITPGVDSTFWKTEYYYYDEVNSQSRTVDISGTSYYFMPSSEVEVTVYFNSTGAHTHDASTLTHVDAVEVTCESDGWLEHWECPVCGKWFDYDNWYGRFNTISKTDPWYKRATGHDPAAPVHENNVDPTCETDGSYEEVVYCRNEHCNKTNKELSRTLIIVPATGHIWSMPEYVWADDYSSVTATHVCENDPSHMESETSASELGWVQEASCLEDGHHFYCSTGFTISEFDYAEAYVYDIPATGHDWDEGTVNFEPDCECDGETVYTCSRCYEQRYEPIPALGHDWDPANITYVWTGDHRKATAEAECARCGLTDTETVTAYESVTAAPTCTAAGQRIHVAAFTSEAFPVQTYQEDIPALGHEWGSVFYEWAPDNSRVTASCRCLRDASHMQSETVTPAYDVLSEPDCVTTGEGLYTAAFTLEGAATQTNTVILPALGHDWSPWTETVPATEHSEGTETRSCSRCHATETRAIPVLTHTHAFSKTNAKAATCTAAGNNAYWYCAGCGRYFSSVSPETECELNSWVIPALGHDYQNVVTLPTCTAQGYTTHTCSRCGDRYQDSYTVALGHDWKAPSWSWAGDYSTASATFVCSRDAAHRQTLNAAVSSVRTEPSWAADGEITYTAIVTFGGHTYSDSKTVILPKPRTRSATMRDSTARTVAVTVNLDTAQVRTNGAAAMSAPVLVAAYDEKGRFKGVEFVTATIAEADTPDGTAAIEIMWIDGSAKPKAEAVDTDLLE